MAKNYFCHMLLRVFRESILMALRELYVNKLRTILSLLGISIGIICMIAIFSGVDSVQNNLQTSINKLGENVIYVSKFPWAVDDDDKEKDKDVDQQTQWMKYRQRPTPTTEELKMIQDNCNTAA